MKKIAIAILSMFIAGIAFCATFSTGNTYVAGKSIYTITLDSTTLNFKITDILLWSQGNYAVVTSSFQKGATDAIYVTPGTFVDYAFPANPVLLSGTTASFTLSLQPSTTIYYLFQGTK